MRKVELFRVNLSKYNISTFFTERKVFCNSLVNVVRNLILLMLQTPADTRSNALLDVITVEANKRYRFRLINSFCAICAGQLYIENHNFTVIAIDGLPVKPVQVDSIISFAGT